MRAAAKPPKGKVSVDAAKLRVLREKAASFEALVGHFPDLYFRFTEDGVVQDFRAHVSSELYAPPEVFLARIVWDVLPAEVSAALRAPMREALDTGRIVTAEYALQMPTGEQWYEARFIATDDRQVICFVRNVTAAVRVKVELEHTISLLRATLDATADAILAVDREGRIETFNAKFVQLWSIPDEVLATRSDDDALTFVLGQLVDPAAFLDRVRELYANPEEEGQDILSFRDGRTVERSSRPLTRAGRSGGRVWSFRDVTLARRAAVERDRMLVETQEAVSARDEFLSIASHELRTPLTSLRLSLQNLRKLAQKPGGLASAAPELVATVMATAERQTGTLRRLVNELLSVSRIQVGRLDLAVRDMDLAALVREVLRNLEEDIARSGASVSLDTPSAPVEGRWDPSRLEQVVTNMVTNALRYGEGKPVEIRVAADRHMARLEVRDHGNGIAPELQRRVFERFERGVPSSHHGGLGLGLYIVRQIVEAHGGDVQVASEAGQGATFIVTLPTNATERAGGRS